MPSPSQADRTKFLKLVPPPKRPASTGPASRLATVEKHLGLSFPEDYRWLVSTYGSGYFGASWSIDLLNPFHRNYESQVYSYLSATYRYDEGAKAEVARRRAERPSDRAGIASRQKRVLKYPLFPEPGGLFIWGHDANGNRYFWRTKGPAPKWPIVIRLHDSERMLEEHDLSVFEYLRGALCNRMRTRVLVGFDRSEKPEFTRLAMRGWKKPELDVSQEPLDPTLGGRLKKWWA